MIRNTGPMKTSGPVHVRAGGWEFRCKYFQYEVKNNSHYLLAGVFNYHVGGW
jgi:hypothetical protein